MAIVPASSGDGALVELEAIGDSMESFARLLDSQRELFHSQIDQLQKIVVAQCKLTGVNPLAQEMAAGALSINIGKRPRDLLNPKAIKYMQSIFAFKDTIGKKETREISALCGVTVTQVREFFASQRSRVRKLVRLSREKATRLEASKVALDGCSSNFGQPLPLGGEASANSHSVDPMANQCTQVPNNYGNLNAIQGGPQVSLNTTEPKTIQETPSCSLPHEETIPGIDSEERKFLENIFNLMRKEETFSGQVKLMEWVLQIQNTAVLLWFLTKDGLAILSLWLSQAALEEQTSVLVVLFKVLCHLPLHKAIPEQMSVILQTVNKLRFYRSSDISNRARILLSRWSKILIRNQALRKSFFPKSPKDAQKEIIRKQRIREILSDESWQSKIDIPEDILALTGSNDVSRSMEPKRGLKLLMAPGEESNKNNQSVSTSKSKQRRKVLMVEQPDRKSTGRGSLASRANQSRPMSADDIQKAKMRAMFMQNKYGKTDASSENHLQKTEDQECSASKTNKITPPPRTPHLPQLKRNEDKKLPMPARKPSPVKTETDSKPNTSSVENSLERLKKGQIQWHCPPEMKINSLWSVGAGENSKEVEVQMQRNRREKETLYANGCDIPPNPKEPWDVEMDFDDSLTPQVPIDQPPDVDMPDVSSPSPCSPNGVGDTAEVMPATAEVTPATSTSSSAPAGNAPPGPDMELLAVLLKNPELVFALTSGQGTNLTSDQTVVLLDMLKKSGVGLAGAVNGMARGSRDAQEPTSLPSPTPPSESRSGWRSEPSPFTRNPPLLQPHLPGSRGAAIRPSVTPSTPPTLTTILSVPQLSSTINPTPQNLTHLNLVPQNPAPPIQQHQVQSTIYPQQQISNPNVAFSAHHWSSATGVPMRSQPAWPQATVGVVRRDQSPTAPEPSFNADQYNHNRCMYSMAQSQPPLTATVAGQTAGRWYPPTGGTRVETWSPEGSPGRPPELHSSRRGPGWNSDQHNWQSRQTDGSNRWRDRR